MSQDTTLPLEASGSAEPSASAASLPFEIAVVGGGAAGTMAALRAVLNGRRVVFYTGDVDARRRSRAQWVSDVQNVPGMSGRSHPLPHQAMEVVDFLKAHPSLASCLTVLKVSVDTLVKTPTGFQITYTEKKRRGQEVSTHVHQAQTVILATGIMDLQPLLPLPDGSLSIEPIFPYANANQALYCLMSDGHRVLGHATAVLGHTSRAVEVAVTLLERYHPPSMVILTHGKALALDEDAERLLAQYRIPVITSPLTGFVGAARKEGLQGVVLESGETLPVTRLFVALGYTVYNTLALQCGAEVDADGFVQTDANGETAVPGLFVVGDGRAGSRKQIYSAWDSAVSAVECIDLRLRLAGRPIAS